MENPQERFLGWLGGIIDGEGSIYLSVTSHGRGMGRVVIVPGVAVTNTNLLILGKVQELMRGIIGEKTSLRMNQTWASIHNKVPSQIIKSRIPCFNINLTGIKPVYVFLQRLKPYLIGKKEQAETVIKFIELRNENLLKRDHLGRVTRLGYTRDQVLLVDKVRSLNGRKSSETLWNASNLIEDDKGRPSMKVEEITGIAN